jgi:peroxiredoxin
LKYRDKGLVVLGINTSDDRQIALDYLKARQVTFPNILDSSEAAYRAFASKYETLLGMSAVPLTYVIDRKGKVVDAWYDHQEARAKKALKKAGFQQKDD